MCLAIDQRRDVRIELPSSIRVVEVVNKHKIDLDVTFDSAERKVDASDGL
jgi:hypothetical protein